MSGHEVVLFHSALGLRPAVHAFADRLRAAGHVVHVPDLYGGARFDDYEAALAHLERLGGVGAWIERTLAAAAALPAQVVYAGFSNGSGSAELLAATRPGALGAVLMHGALPVEALGVDRWPAAVPVQLHAAAGDPFRDRGAEEAFVAAARAAGARVEVFDYPGEGHLFADPDLPREHDPDAAEQMTGRVLAFLADLPRVPSPPAAR